ncbi:phage terminase large subunit [Helicobacter winghamensis]|uniref:phage terminase large subunit n=1 Tax=Helicobacter winghamensis TaxID=157268 RepID=UPI00351B4CB9
MINIILKLYIKYLSKGKVVKIAIETIAFQEFFKDKLKEEALKLGILLSVCELKNKVAKELRIDSLAPYINDGTILIDPNSHLLIEEMLTYPKSAHDDLLDSAEMAFRIASSAGIADYRAINRLLKRKALKRIFMRILNKNSKAKVAPSVDFESVAGALSSENLSQLIGIYDYFKRFDPQIASEVNKRRIKMCSYPMYIECEDLTQREFLNRYVLSSDFRHFIYELSAGVVYGFSAFLIEWKVKGANVFPCLKYINPRFFNLNDKEILVIKNGTEELIVQDCKDIFLHLHQVIVVIY